MSSIYIFLHVYAHSFILSVISKTTAHPECFRVLFNYSRGVGCQKISEIYPSFHLAAVTRAVPQRGFVHSLVWLLLPHRLQLHCYQVRQGKPYGTQQVVQE